MPTNITKLHNEVLKKHLKEYGTWTFAKTNKAVTSVVINNHQYSMDFKTVCSEALRLLNVNELYALKYEMLVAGLIKRGGVPLYEHIMGEPIERALIK